MGETQKQNPAKPELSRFSRTGRKTHDAFHGRPFGAVSFDPTKNRNRFSFVPTICTVITYAA